MKTPRPAELRAAATTADPRWQAVCRRDAAADGTFVFAVRTTGVFCRPSCSSRRPRPENVEFHADAAKAIRAGYRACQRCQPTAAGPARRQVAVIAKLCRAIVAADHAPSLAELGRIAGWSPWHVQRVFRAVMGVSPHAFARAQRAERARRSLARGASVTSAMHAAGYGSSSRFYGSEVARSGVAPKRARAGGSGERIEFGCAPCSLGTVLVASTARGVCAVLLGDAPPALEADLRQRFPRAELVAGGGAFRRQLAAVVRGIREPERAFDLPLDLRGTAFQQRVWQALRAIPAGTTIGYRELGTRLGIANGPRAIASACAQNPVAVVVPCHRVVRSDGALAGYRWGLSRKRALLENEAERAP